MDHVPVCDWRDPAPYAELGGCGRSGLAWELLRRDAGYRAVVSGQRFVALGRNGNLLRLPASDAAFTGRWGLHFR